VFCSCVPAFAASYGLLCSVVWSRQHASAASYKPLCSFVCSVVDDVDGVVVVFSTGFVHFLSLCSVVFDVLARVL